MQPQNNNNSNQAYDYKEYQNQMQPVKEAVKDFLNNSNVQISNEFSDPIREDTKEKINKYGYNFNFNKSNDIQNFFKQLGLSEDGKNNSNLPYFVYSSIQKNIMQKIYDDFVNIFGEDITKKIKTKEQLFKEIFEGFIISTLDKNKKAIYDATSYDFDSIKNVVVTAIISEVFKNPSLIGITEERQKLYGIFPKENDYFTNKLKVNLNEINNWTQNGISLNQKYLGFMFSDSIAEKEEYRDIFDYMKQVAYEFYSNLRFILQPGDIGNPNLTYKNKCKSSWGNTCRSLVNSQNKDIVSEKDGIISNTIEYLNNEFYKFDFSLQYVLDFYNSVKDPKIIDDVSSQSEQGLKDIKNQIKLQNHLDILYKFVESYKYLVSIMPDLKIKTEFYQIIDGSVKVSEYTIKQIFQKIYEVLIYPIEDIIAYNTSPNIFTQPTFNKYYQNFLNQKKQKVDPYIEKIKNFNIKYPSYVYTEGLISPQFYGPYPKLEISLLYDKKADLYLNKDPKILFSFEKPQIFSFDKIEEPLKNTYGPNNYEPSKQQKFLNSIQPTNIFVYKTDADIINFKTDLVSDTFLRKLDVTKNELSFYENLEPNKDYYYFYLAARDQQQDLNDNKIYYDFNPANQWIYGYENLSYIIVNDNLYYIGSPIIKLRLVKDGNFYYLEQKLIELSYFYKEQYKNSFKEKIKFIPKGEAFVIGKNGFENGKEYLKIRVTSKKTRKKIDLNLKYTINEIKTQVDDIDTSSLENIEEMVDGNVKQKIKQKFSNMGANSKFEYWYSQGKFTESLGEMTYYGFKSSNLI